MHYTYKTKGTCSTHIDYDIEDNKIYNLKYMGGCDGNLKAVAALLEGEEIPKVISRLKGIKCGFRKTSCADQLAKSLEEVYTNNK